MNVQDYRKRKEAGSVVVMANGGGIVTVILHQYNSATAEREPDNMFQYNIAGVDREREALVEQQQKLADTLLDLDAFIADVKEADAAFGKNLQTGKDILGKK